MQETEEIVDLSTEQVHISHDYDDFVVYEFNRELIEPLVEEIVESIEENGYFPGKAVLVIKQGDKKAIVDGQHRFTACVRKNEPIRYVWLPAHVDPLKLIISMNAKQRSWTLINFVNAWAKSGKKCYQELLRFEEQHRLGISNSIVIFMGNIDTNNTTRIKDGKEFKPYSRATEIAWFISRCEDMVPFAKSGSFVRASLNLFKNAKDEQIKKVEKSIISIPQLAKVSDYLAAFENIINKGQRKDKLVSLRVTK